MNAIHNAIAESLSVIENEIAKIIERTDYPDTRKFLNRVNELLPRVKDAYRGHDPEMTSMIALKDFKNNLYTFSQRLEIVLTNNTKIDESDGIHEIFDRVIYTISQFYPKFGDVDAYLSELKNADDKARTAFDNLYKTASINIESRSKSAEKASTDFDTLVKTYTKEAELVLDRLTQFEHEGKKVLHIYSGFVLESAFSERAKGESRKARWWTFFTVLSALSSIGLLGYIFWMQIVQVAPIMPNDGKIDFQFLSTKILLALTLGVIARWTSKRANLHLAEESKYHRLALNLKTVDAFIKNIDKSKQDEVIAAIANKLFTETAGNDMQIDYDGSVLNDTVSKFIAK